MKPLRISILFTLLVIITTNVFTQELSQTFRGTVVDAYTEVPLPGATVIILNSSPLKGTSTDVDGQFRMDDMPLGRFDIEVRMMGYQPTTIHNLLLGSGRELVITVRLEEQVYLLDDVEVRPELRKDQPLNEMAVISARSFTIDETERYAGSLGDPSRMAANFAGVSSASDQRNDIIIRGNSPLGLLWRLEGVEIPNPNHFGSIGSTGGPVSMLNNNQLDNSDFYTGAFPAEYGNALAGAFDLRMRNGNNQQHEFMGQVGFNGFELGAEGPFSSKNRASFMVNARYSTLEVLHALGSPGDGFGTGAAIPNYKDLSFKIHVPLERGRISVFGIGGYNSISMLDSEDDDAQYGFAGTDLYFSNRMGVSGISHVYYFNTNTRINNTIAVSGIRSKANIFELTNGLDKETIIEDLGEIRYSLSSKLSHRFNSRNFLNTGLIVDHYDISYHGQEYHEASEEYRNYLDADGTMQMVRGFGEWQHRFSDEFSVNSGLHLSAFLLNNSYAIEPRVGVKWSFLPGQSVSLGAGMHSQMQMKGVYFSQMLIDSISLTYERTNEHLDLSRSLHLVAGYDRLLGEGHRLKTEVYYQYLYNIPVAAGRPEFSTLNQGGAFNYWVFNKMENSGTGSNVGVELTLEKFLQEGFYYLITASVFDSKYRGYDRILRNTAFNNNYIFNVLTGYEWKIGQRSLLSADIKLVYAGGNRFLEIDREQSILTNSVKYQWETAYDNRYPDYFRLNGRVTFRLNGQNVNQEWALDLQNVTNKQNIFTENWNRNRQEITTSYQMGFMPMMTYRIYF